MVLRINGLGHGPLADRRLLGERQQRGETPGESPPRQEQDTVERRYTRSEQLRAEFAAINGAIRETEEALALVNAARGGLRAVSGHLERLAVRLWSPAEAAPDTGAMAPQDAVDQALAAIAQLALSASFGARRLLDGSLGCSGMARGDGLEFVSAAPQTRSSPPQGYEVLLTQEPVRTTLLGERPLKPPLLDAGVRLLLREGEGSARWVTRAEQTPRDVAAGLQAAAQEGGLALIVEATEDGRLLVQHRLFGAAHRFAAASSEPGVLSTPEGGPQIVANGQDIAGTLNGEPAEGLGEVLTGCVGNATTAGLAVRYTGMPFTGATGRLPHRRISVLTPRVFAGRVVVAQQALPLHLDAGLAAVTYLRLDSVRPEHLARGVPNPLGWASLAEVRADSPVAAHAARGLVEHALGEVARQDESLAALAEGPLTGTLTRLQVQAQNLAAITQDLVAPGAAILAVQALSRHIVREARAALSAQTHPPQGALLELLDDAPTPARPGSPRLN